MIPSSSSMSRASKLAVSTFSGSRRSWVSCEDRMSTMAVIVDWNEARQS